VLVFLLMLVLVLTVADHAVGHLLNRRLPFNIPESGVTMLLGMVLGGLITLLGKCSVPAFLIARALCIRRSHSHTLAVVLRLRKHS
jgi:hypothetical protein